MVESGGGEVVRVARIADQGGDIDLVGVHVHGLDPRLGRVEDHQLAAEPVEGVGQQLPRLAVSGDQQEGLTEVGPPHG